MSTFTDAVQGFEMSTLTDAMCHRGSNRCWEIMGLMECDHHLHTVAAKGETQCSRQATGEKPEAGESKAMQCCKKHRQESHEHWPAAIATMQCTWKSTLD
eukprot:610248-Pelagomonas_calceolata.AAC.5